MWILKYYFLTITNTVLDNHILKPSLLSPYNIDNVWFENTIKFHLDWSTWILVAIVQMEDLPGFCLDVTISRTFFLMEILRNWVIQLGWQLCQRIRWSTWRPFGLTLQQTWPWQALSKIYKYWIRNIPQVQFVEMNGRSSFSSRYLYCTLVGVIN